MQTVLRRSCLFFYVLFSATSAYGQLTALNTLRSFHHYDPGFYGDGTERGCIVGDDTTDEWVFGALGYLRNTEFFHPMEAGRTLFGSQALAYWHSGYDQKTYLELGGLANVPFGGKTQIYPHVAVIHNINHVNVLRFGTLSNPGHDLPEPLYNPGRRYTHPVEYGFQYISPYTDAWIHWEQATTYGSMQKESFTAGWNQNNFRGSIGFGPYSEGPMLSHRSSLWINSRFYALYHHVGGQIDNAPPQPTGNRIQTGVDIHVTPYLVGQKRAPKGQQSAEIWRFTLPTYSYTLLRYDDPLQAFGPVKVGYGQMHSLAETFKGFILKAGYWQGNSWISPLGQGLYQSLNPEDASVTFQGSRQMLMLSAQKEWGSMGFRYDAYFDMDLGKWSTAFTLNMAIKERRKRLVPSDAVHQPQAGDGMVEIEAS
ncbi:MAG: hypothetical protein ISP50_01340 [Cryomorphaceae bacterium]|nr:hypothetical protein [Cryomorphaceae bacterium]